ncbi:hypothetical protein [Halopseudomonas laoshanensis]|uniref:hypothetical protein n=1 Tax=Halopseudomonas laoshanensis TaxID=2268758 RepID=UPI00373619B2
MDSARDRLTLEIVEAEDLKLLTSVDTYGYQCPGCTTQAFPRSYRSENLVRAHFQLRDPHYPGCEIEGEEKIIAQGRRGSVQRELETSPGLSPARLQLIEVRTIVDSTIPRTEIQTQRIHRLNGVTDEARRDGRRAANSIRPICRAFLRFPFDRHLSLAVPGIAPTAYQTAFKKLRSNGLEHFPDLRIFYGELAWTPAAESFEHLTITLNAGKWDQKTLTPYQVIVEWDGWSTVARSRLKRELEVARQENIKANKECQRSRSYLFFVGAQDARNITIFRIMDHRLICTVHDELVFPR